MLPPAEAAEDEQTGDEGATACDQVAERAGRQQQRREHERVRVDPQRVGLRRAGGAGQVRQADVEHGLGRHDDGETTAHRCQDVARLAAVGGGHC